LQLAIRASREILNSVAIGLTALMLLAQRFVQMLCACQ
jgi:hypothetical protein